MAPRFTATDIGEGESAILELASKVATAEGIEPVDLTPPIGDRIDADALSALLENSESDIRVNFTYRDWKVTFHSVGDVTLTAAGD